MPGNLQTPGVYIRVQDEPPVLPPDMSVAGLVGQALRGPVNYPQPLNSWGQFQDIFDSFTGFSYLPFAVYGFFQNGGRRCYVVRVTHETAAAAAAKLADAGGVALIAVAAANSGKWGADVELTVDDSSQEIVLTQLAAPASGQTVKLNSVAGIQPGDALTLVDPANPLSRQTLPVAAVDRALRSVTFQSAVSAAPVGTNVTGTGLRITVQYRPGGVLARQETFDNLAMDPAHPSYFVRVINGLPADPDYANRIRNGQSILIAVTDLAQGAGGRPAPLTLRLENGTDGPADKPGLDWRYYTGYDAGAYFRPPGGDAQLHYGLAAFEEIPAIGLVAIPDLGLPDLYAAASGAGIQLSPEGIVFTAIPDGGVPATNLKPGQADMLAHCALMQDRFAILDSPRGARIGQGASPIDGWTANFRLAPSSRNATLYYPWIRQRAADFDGADLLIPPSGHLAGVYARVEQQRSIGKAPANEVVQGIIDLEFCLGDDQQAVLNPISVNCLRALPGRGLRVWGARTLSADPAWRYVNLRRVYEAIVKNILLNLRWTVFEPNTPKLWAKVVATLTAQLSDLFRAGALAGNRQEDAFFVQCDNQTNTADSIGRGEMVVRVGFAPAQPAEFVVVTIRRTAESLVVNEQA